MQNSINLVANPYLQGQVFDSSPFTQYYLQQDAHKKAKEEAFNGYLNDLQKNVTPTGMRTQDVGGFTNKANEWMQYGIQNKKAIQDPTLDGGKARMQFLGLHQDLLGDISSSKGEVEKAKELAAIRNDPEKMNRIDPATIEDWGRANYSIYDKKNFKPLDTTGVHFKPKDFDQIKHQEEIDKLYPTASMGDEKATPIAGDPYNQTVVGTKGRTKEQIADLAKMEQLNYVSNPEFKGFVDNNIAAQVKPEVNTFGQPVMSPFYKHYDELFQKHFGRQMDLTKGNHDLAAAYGLDLGSKTVPYSATKANEAYARKAKMQDRVTEMNAEEGKQARASQRTLANEKEMVDYRNAHPSATDAESKKAVQAANDDASVDNYINQQYDLGKDKVRKTTIEGKQYSGRAIKLPPSLQKQFATANKTNRLGNATNMPAIPDEYILTDDKQNLIPMYYSGTDKGKLKPSPTGKVENAGVLTKHIIPVSTIYKPNIKKYLSTTKSLGNQTQPVKETTPPKFHPM